MKVLGIVLIFSNLVAAGMNFYLGNSGNEAMDKMKGEKAWEWIIIYFPFYAIAEFLPSMSYSIIMKKISEVV